MSIAINFDAKDGEPAAVLVSDRNYSPAELTAIRFDKLFADIEAKVCEILKRREEFKRMYPLTSKIGLTPIPMKRVKAIKTPYVPKMSRISPDSTPPPPLQSFEEQIPDAPNNDDRNVIQPPPPPSSSRKRNPASKLPSYTSITYSHGRRI
jgi:hypothetical protein